MIKIDVEQGSAKWRLCRYGIVTASEADNLITPAKWEPTKGERREKFLCQKIAERIALHDTAGETDVELRCAKIERTLNRIQTEGMLHGIVSEPRAVAAYKFLTGNETEPAGFILNDDRTAGASVDRMIKNSNRGLEIKSPFSLAVYVGYCEAKGVDATYLPQLMFQMMVAELDSVDIYAWYDGRSESEPIRVDRDDDKIKKLREVHAEFSAALESRWGSWKNKLIQQ